MLLKVGWLENLTRLSYTLFDFSLAGAALMAALLISLRWGLPARALKAGISGTTS
jgi:hypothetical protein